MQKNSTKLNALTKVSSYTNPDKSVGFYESCLFVSVSLLSSNMDVSQ